MAKDLARSDGATDRLDTEGGAEVGQWYWVKDIKSKYNEETEKHEDAIKYLVATMASFKEADQKAEAQLLIGRGHSAAMRQKEATAAFTAALGASPSWARGDEALILLSRSFRAMDDRVSADRQLRLLLTKYPQSTFLPQAIYDIAEIAYQQEKHDDAISR